MKTTAKPRKPTLKRRAVGLRARLAPSARLSDEEFRRQLHLELADEIRAARKAAKARFGHLIRPLTPAEIEARSARIRAMFASWQEENRKNPVTREESESYDRMLARMAAERAG